MSDSCRQDRDRRQPQRDAARHLEPGRRIGRGHAWLRVVAITGLGIGLVPGSLALFTAEAQPTVVSQAKGVRLAAHQRPNIIVIQTDDQDTASLTRRVMPNVVKLLGRHGTTFTDYIDSGPLCCPSRAVMLTGQYGHNNGVLWNTFNPYGDLRGKHNTLPVWLHRAGYRTAHLGRYFNLYAFATGDPNEVAPGWDEWDTVLEPVGTTPPSYYDYTLRQNGHAVEYGSRPRDYLTRVLNDKAVHLIHRFVPRRKPLFIALDQIAPHSGGPPTDPRCHHSALPAPRDLDLFVNEPLPISLSFNETDVSEKPSFIRDRPRLTMDEIAELRRKQGCRLASLHAVDRGVKRIVNALRHEHELRNTAIYYTSDNGYLLGEHRLHGKVNPYEEALHVPFIARLPQRFRGPRGAPRTLSSTVANVDVAPTILRLAGAQPCPRIRPCRVLDGRSLLRAIRSHGTNWPHGRGILLELKTTWAGELLPCDYQGVRTTHQVFVEYHAVAGEEQGPCSPDDEVEHYDLRSDPFELNNLFPAPSGSDVAAKEHSLADRLARLRDCVGIEGRDPVPSSGHYCE
jgi:N-acetylglucosamine-6-sulfatase